MVVYIEKDSEAPFAVSDVNYDDIQLDRHPSESVQSTQIEKQCNSSTGQLICSGQVAGVSAAKSEPSPRRGAGDMHRLISQIIKGKAGDWIEFWSHSREAILRITVVFQTCNGAVWDKKLSVFQGDTFRRLPR